MTCSPTAQFLKRILPEDGWLCTVVFPKKQHIWVKTVEELEQKILQLDALEQRNLSVYHACSSFKSPNSREQSNIQAVRSLWLDVDVGDKKPYATLTQAIQALDNFRRVINLPPPMYIGSGYGLHAYWPLVKSLSLFEWSTYSRALKYLCQTHSFYADPVRTADASSILRTVGTYNRKNPDTPKKVEWGGDVEPYNLNELAYLLTVEAPSKKPLVTGMLAALVNTHSYTPSNPHQIADQCAQIAHLRSTQGLMSEPEWKACLGVIAFCDAAERDVIAHEWSKGDARYNPEETQRKLESSKTLSGPTTCAHFQTLNTRCNTCPFKHQVTSPLELGRGPPKLTPLQKAFAENMTLEEKEFPAVGSFAHKNGTLVFQTEKNGKENYVRISQYPVVVEAISRGETNIESHSVVLKYRPPLEGWQTISIPLKTLFGASGIADIVGRGIMIHNGDLFRQYVRESVDKLNAERRVQVQFEQFGWKNDDSAFLIGTRLYTATGIVESPGGQEIRRRGLSMGPQKKGSLMTWRDNVDMLFAPGFEAQGFATLASFSAPFMRWQAHSEGGAILSLVSRKGGKGKTTALTAAASVWGTLAAMKQINSDTRVGKSIFTGIMGNLPIIRDEYTQRDPEALREEIQIFTEGRDKQRGTAEGTLISVPLTWQTIMIAGSNTSLVDTLRAAKNGEAMAGRVVEFLVDIPKGAEHWKGDTLKDNIDDNGGYAGEVFIRTVLQPENLQYLKRHLPNVREELIRKHELTSDQRFVARLLAGVAVAGAVVRQLDLLSISVDRIMEWAQDTLFETDSHGKPKEEPTYLLARFLAENIQNTLVMPDAFRSKAIQMPLRVPTHKLLIRREVISGRMYIEIKTLRVWMQKEEQPWKDLIEDLKEKGLLINPNRLITLGAGTEMATGQVPALEINANHPIITGALANAQNLERTG